MRNKRKFNKTKEWLINEYVVNNRPRKEIAAECGLSEAGLKSLLKDWGIQKDKLIVTKEQLEECINNKMSAEEIAAKFGVYVSTIYKWNKKYGLTILAEPKNMNNMMIQMMQKFVKCMKVECLLQKLQNISILLEQQYYPI